MSLRCQSGAAIRKGDAVCVVGFDAPNTPIVVSATAANLANSRTVLGVAEAAADDAGRQVVVLVTGDVASATLTGLGAGASNIIATDITNPDMARLKRVARPDGSEHIVGTCDTNGHTSIQPRASHDTSAQHVFNVKAYGARGDGSTDDTAAIYAAIAAMPLVEYPGTLYFPPGNYRCAGDLHLTRSCVMTGAGASQVHGGSASTITFDAGKSLIVDAQTTAFLSPRPGGFGQKAIIQQLHIVSSHIPGIAQWTANQPHDVGDLIAANTGHGTAVRFGTGDYSGSNDNRYYFECIKSGTEVKPMTGNGRSAASSPDFQFAYNPDLSRPWREIPSSVVQGMQVRTAALDVVWECTTAGTKGGSEPVWDREGTRFQTSPGSAMGR